MNRISLFIAVILLLWGCETQENMGTDFDSAPIIPIESKAIVKGVKLSKLLTDVKFVPLETADKCLIGQLDQLEFSNGDIIAMDMQKAKSIYRFSKDGAFLNTISKQGQGPGEYEFLPFGNICVNPNNPEEIAISSRNKLMIYNTNNAFLREIPLFAHAYTIGWYDHRIALYTGSDDSDLTLIEERKGQEISRFFDTDIAIKMILPYPFQLYQNKDLLYFTNLDYTIYRISEDNIYPHVRFTFDKPMYTKKDLALIEEDSYNMYKFINIRYYNENASHIFMTYIDGMDGYMVIHDKLNSKTTAIAMRDIENDLFFTESMPVAMAVSKTGVFCCKHP